MEGHLPLLQMPEAQRFYTAHKIEYLWETCTVNFIGARFVVLYFIKPNPAGSSCSPCVCWAMNTLLFGNMHLHFIYFHSCLVVCVWVDRLSDFSFQMINDVAINLSKSLKITVKHGWKW